MKSTSRIAEITIELEKKKQNPILIAEFIDLKVENDMEKVLQRMDVIELNIERFEKNINTRLDKQTTNMKWILGIGITVLSIVLTLLKIF